MQVGWLIDDKRFHIASINYKKFLDVSYTTICNNNFLSSTLRKSFMYPNGRNVPGSIILNKNRLCVKCTKIYIKKHSKETFNFEFIKLKLGIKCLN